MISRADQFRALFRSLAGIRHDVAKLTGTDRSAEVRQLDVALIGIESLILAERQAKPPSKLVQPPGIPLAKMDGRRYLPLDPLRRGLRP